jgi:hypothetical protein
LQAVFLPLFGGGGSGGGGAATLARVRGTPAKRRNGRSFQLSDAKRRIFQTGSGQIYPKHLRCKPLSVCLAELGSGFRAHDLETWAVRETPFFTVFQYPRPFSSPFSSDKKRSFAKTGSESLDGVSYRYINIHYDYKYIITIMYNCILQ